MAPKFKDSDDQIHCSSPTQLAAHIDSCQTLFLQPESEHTWEKFAKALDKLAALTRGGAAKLESFPAAVGPANQGGLGDKIVQCVLSERAALSRPAVELVTAIAVSLQRDFSERLQRVYIPPLLDLIRRTNNIVRERAEHALFTILRACPLGPLIGHLSACTRDANPKLRRAVCAGLALAVDGWRAGGRVEEVEGMVRGLAEDRDGEVRKAARELWDKYKRTWPERVLAFIDPLSPSTKKRLDIKENDTYPILSSSSSSARSPSQSPAAALAAEPDPTGGGGGEQQAPPVPVKKMGAKSFIAQRKAELARQAAAARAVAAAAAAASDEAEGEVAPSGGDSAAPPDGPLPSQPSMPRSQNGAATPAERATTPSASSTTRSPSTAAVAAMQSPSSPPAPVVEAAPTSTSPSAVQLDRDLTPLPPSQPSTPAKPFTQPSSSPSMSPLAQTTTDKTAPSSPWAPSSPAAAASAASTSTPIRPPRSAARRPSEAPSPPSSSAVPEADPSPSSSTPLRPTQTSPAAEAPGPSTPNAGALASSQRAFATPLAHQPTTTSRSAALRAAAAFTDSPVPSLQLGRRSQLDSASASSLRHRDLLDGREQRELADWRRLKAGFTFSGPSSSSPARLTRATLDDLPSEESVGAVLSSSAAYPVGHSTPRSKDRLELADLDDSEDDDQERGRTTSAAAATWKEGGLFDDLLEQLFNALKVKSVAATESDSVERYLVLLEALVENQRPLLEGHEGPLVSALLDLRRRQRSSPASPVLRQGSAHVLALVLGPPLEPVVALYTLGSSLRTLVDPSPSLLLQSAAGEDVPPVGFPPVSPASSASVDDDERTDAEAAAPAFAFGLLALGRTLLRLPAEVVAEELPRLRDLLLPGLYSSVLAVRESAATAILAAQLVIRDETTVFSLLERLTADKVNLLTYLFEKNKIRDPPRPAETSEQPSSRERLERELRRLSLQP